MPTYILIDSPLTPLSTEKEVLDWISRLSRMDRTNKQVKDELSIAKRHLKLIQDSDND